MFKKFLSLFTWWKRGDRGVTKKPNPQLACNVNADPPYPRPAPPWTNPAGTNRRIKPEVVAPFGTGTPHDRMHGLIAAGKPDALIAIELGVGISAVRNYRHIISARGREAARRAAGSRLPPRVLDSAWINREQSDHREWQRRKAAERVPAALLRRAEKLDEAARINETYGKFYNPDLSQSVTAERCAEEMEERVRQNETFGARAASSPLYDPALSQSVTAEGCARVRATLDDLSRIESQCSTPSSDISSGQGSDFDGAGATGSWDGDRS